MKYFLAIDIGASSGRHIVGWREDGQIKTDEVFRFPNGVVEKNGHLTWDLKALYKSVTEGVDAALEKYPEIESLAIDTWGCDYVLFKGNREIKPCYAYRDNRTSEAIDGVHSRISFSELYEKTGIQFQPFNTIYQLYADSLSGRLNEATDFLMIPEYLAFKLTGKKVKEYTNATTTGLVDAVTGEFDGSIIKKLNLPERLFPKLNKPTAKVGTYKGIKVILCATHDTASAVEGIPMEGDELYISSGTWSLLGVKIPQAITDEESRDANYSNEGGVGYIRYLKNITGMWIVNRLRSELCPETPFPEIVKMAMASTYSGVCDVNSPEFLSPQSMVKAFDFSLEKRPEQVGDYFRCAYVSLAENYRRAIAGLEKITGKQYKDIYIVGGGAKNGFLNELTQNATGKRVIALPIEATAIGNLKIQIEANL